MTRWYWGFRKAARGRARPMIFTTSTLAGFFLAQMDHGAHGRRSACPRASLLILDDLLDVGVAAPLSAGERERACSVGALDQPIRSFSEGSAVSNNSAPIPSGVTGSEKAFDRTTTAMSRGDPPGLRRRTELVRTDCSYRVCRPALHSLSGSLRWQVSARFASPIAQVLVLVR